jgi:hypothetical protein
MEVMESLPALVDDGQGKKNTVVWKTMFRRTQNYPQQEIRSASQPLEWSVAYMECGEVTERAT